jgi:hypothetical protein
MPFAGDERAAREAVATLKTLRVIPGDELILADNVGLAPSDPAVTVVRALAERSPAHARNSGASVARNEWILFLDADCLVGENLLDAYFAHPIDEAVGALAGEVRAARERDTLAARYGAARSFLDQAAHMAHPYMPRAVAANLMVRRSAFEEVGGFYEGLRAAEDTDFSWRLQRAGWRLELRPDASVQHRYRTSVRELRAQWRSYAAGRAWLRRRYRDFTPQPAAGRALKRAFGSLRRGGPGDGAQPQPRGQGQPRSYLLLDTILGFDELAGFALSNRPARARSSRATQVVLVADRFPARGDPLVDFARTVDNARVEAGARPQSPWLEVVRELEISYSEDDGVASRALALAWLLLRHPIRALQDTRHRRAGERTLRSLAPAALRVERSHADRIHPLGGTEVQTVARRLAALTGRGLDGK